MKKIFSKKSGFTLVEIVVAFAVFAIFAAMIMQILHLTINKKNENREYEQELANQQQALAAKTKTTTYDGNPDGQIKIKFSDTSLPEMQINYETVNANGEKNTAGINYFVGDVNYSASGGTSNSGGDTSGGDPGDIGGGSQTSRYDTRITGTKGISYIQIIDVTKNSKTNYTIKVCADGTGVQEDNKPYEQYTLYFDTSKTDDSGNPLGAKIIELQPITPNGYSVRQSGDRGVRIGVQNALSNTTVDTNKLLKASNVVEFKIILDKAPTQEITINSFGTNDDGTTKSDGKYTSFKGNENIYGAYDPTDTSTPTSTPTT